MNLKKKIRYLAIKTVGQYINAISYIFPEKALEISYGLFSEPRIGKISKNKLPKILQDTHKETFQHNGHHFQTYTWKGNETKILLVHGWESNSSRWKKTLPYLQKSGSTIIAIDAPAHGQSSGKEFNVPRYVEFINKVVQQSRPDFIIGHSIGGAACVYHQYLFPNSSIQKMVVLGAPSDLKTLLDNYIQMLSLNDTIFRLLAERYVKHFNFKIEDFSGKKFASQITIEGLIVHDKSDKIVSFDEGLKLASSWKNSRLIETEGLGHSMHDDDLYKKIYRFLFEGE